MCGKREREKERERDYEKVMLPFLGREKTSDFRKKLGKNSSQTY